MVRWIAALAILISCGEDKPRAQESSADPSDSAGPAAGDLARSGAMSVLSYNVHGLPSLITGDDTPARMEQIAPLLQAWDVLGLQEDWDTTNHQTLVGQTDHPVKLWFDAIVSADRFYGSGLTVMSVYPAIDEHLVHYTTCSGILDGASDCLASKGFQAIRSQVGAGQIDFYNTHLEAGGGEEDNAARAVQIEQLLESLSGWSAGEAIVFTGDFNLHADDPDDAPLLARLEAEAGLQDACALQDCPTTHHIDRVFIRSSDTMSLSVTAWSDESERFLDTEGVDLSDHPPISATIFWSVTDNSQP